MFFKTNGTSNGLIPMLRVFNNTSRYVDQGGNKVCFRINLKLNLKNFKFFCLFYL